MDYTYERDSFVKEFHSTVISCNSTTYNSVVDGKKQSLKCYELILKDTIFFPEGGGQPCDLGVVNDIPVIQVLRRGKEVALYIEKYIKKGERVLQKIDWDRRFDHMQQHSGQHLITALAESEFGYTTTSWWLGEEICFIELDAPKIKEDILASLEIIVNEKIRQAIPIKVGVYEEGDLELSESRTRGLPKDHKGSVRVVTIEGIESNMCCGTHVTNLSQLQIIKLLGFEKGKKGKTNMNFIVGNRVFKKLDKMYKNELNLNILLRNGPDAHADLIEKLQKSAKLTNKKAEKLMKDLVVHQVKSIKSKAPPPKVVAVHRPDAEIDYANMFIKELNDPNILLMLTIGEKEGHLFLHGPEDKVSELGPKLAELLDGKGNATGNRYQAKVKNLKNLKMAEALIKDSIKDFV